MLQFAICDIERAFKQLEFSIKLMCYSELGHIDLAKFDTDVTIILDNDNIGFPTGNFQSAKDIILASQINVGVCFGLSAIVLDAAFASVGIKGKPESRDQMDELRTLVYMVRCAFAHNIAYPRWEARGPYSRKIEFYLDQVPLLIDLEHLNGQDFEYSHIGGFANWYKIRDLSLQWIKSI